MSCLRDHHGKPAAGQALLLETMNGSGTSRIDVSLLDALRNVYRVLHSTRLDLLILTSTFTSLAVSVYVYQQKSSKMATRNPKTNVLKGPTISLELWHRLPLEVRCEIVKIAMEDFLDVGCKVIKSHVEVSDQGMNWGFRTFRPRVVDKMSAYQNAFVDFSKASGGGEVSYVLRDLLKETKAHKSFACEHKVDFEHEFQRMEWKGAKRVRGEADPEIMAPLRTKILNFDMCVYELENHLHWLRGLDKKLRALEASHYLHSVS